MGYKINSPWTELRKKDIERLNEIIDDRYCIENEIGRKLNIMEVFEQLFDEAIKDFKFDIVLEFMNKNGWKWSMYEDGKSFYKVPNRIEMIRMMRREFLKPGLYNIIELNKKEWGASTGGIVFDMGILGNYASKDNCYLNIYFDIAHFVKD